MKGCLTTIFIFFIGLAFNNFLDFIGMLIDLWAIYEWKVNQNLVSNQGKHSATSHNSLMEFQVLWS